MTDWDRATWLNRPPAVTVDGSDLLVTAGQGSDFWRTTSYGFVRDSGHALLTDLLAGQAVEVSFVADFVRRYDQAGVLLRADAQNWVKAGVERSDGQPQLGAVVTRDFSDWSLQPVPEWGGHPVTIRVSRGADAITIRARRRDGPWQLVRLAPFRYSGPVGAGPYCCAPTRAGLQVRFLGFEVGGADTALHHE